jgi:anti-sigma factor RsiW
MTGPRDLIGLPSAAALERDDDPDGLVCVELVELVTDYLEGAMSPPERERFERHLATCGGCTAYLVQMEATIAAVGRIEPGVVRPEVLDRLIDAYREMLRTRPTSRDPDPGEAGTRSSP